MLCLLFLVNIKGYHAFHCVTAGHGHAFLGQGTRWWTGTGTYVGPLWQKLLEHAVAVVKFDMI